MTLGHSARLRAGYPATKSGTSKANWAHCTAHHSRQSPGAEGLNVRAHCSLTALEGLCTHMKSRPPNNSKAGTKGGEKCTCPNVHSST